MVRTRSPVIGIIGSDGAYGRWFRQFFAQVMGLTVYGYDPNDCHSPPLATVIEQADVLLFAVPIAQAPQIVAQVGGKASPRQADQLWLDISSVKQPVVAAMRRSQAEIIGLHPMTAPPRQRTLAGQKVLICLVRAQHWLPWFELFCQQLQASFTSMTVCEHDRWMALVQATTHGLRLLQAKVLAEFASDVGGLQRMMTCLTPGLQLDLANIARILSLNERVYTDIQFINPAYLPVLDGLLAHLQQLRAWVSDGQSSAQLQFRTTYFAACRQAWRDIDLSGGHAQYQYLVGMLADFSLPTGITVSTDQDTLSLLTTVIAVIVGFSWRLSAVHSLPATSGRAECWLGFEQRLSMVQLEELSQALAHQHITMRLSAQPPSTSAG